MTEHNTDSVNDTSVPEITLSDLQHEATMLASMIEGLCVLEENAGGDHMQSKRASNGLTAMLEVVIEKAWELTSRIDKAERMSRREAVRA